MPDHPTRAQLRTPAPTLEPDDAFLARLSSLAAAGAPAPASAAAPRVTWRVGLAAASVAAVLVGVAWLSGLGTTDSPDPLPPATPGGRTPLPSTSLDGSTGTSGDPSSETTSGDSTGPASSRSPDGSAGATSPGTRGPGSHPTGATGAGEGASGEHDTPGSGESQDPGEQSSGHPGQGPDEHAGDHPDEHASDHPTGRPDDADRVIGEHAGDGAGGRQAR